MSTIIWEKLTEKEKQWVEEAARESALYQRKLWQESEKFCLEEVQKAGVKIIHPEKETFASKVQPLYDEYKDNEEIYSLIQQIQTVE
jgi:TRAP-type C4-dicarboxylate transport system substrate-binding protein